MGSVSMLGQDFLRTLALELSFFLARGHILIPLVRTASIRSSRRGWRGANERAV